MHVTFIGGPFDGRRAFRPRFDVVNVHSGVDGNVQLCAVYAVQGDTFVFQRERRVHELIGGPLDGTLIDLLESARPVDDAIVVPHEGKYLWYKPLGGGRYQFDGVLEEKDLELGHKEA